MRPLSGIVVAVSCGFGFAVFNHEKREPVFRGRRKRRGREGFVRMPIGQKTVGYGQSVDGEETQFSWNEGD